MAKDLATNIAFVLAINLIMAQILPWSVVMDSIDMSFEGILGGE
jgi:hypothetical protein